MSFGGDTCNIKKADLLQILFIVLILLVLSRLFIAGAGYFSVVSLLKGKWYGEPRGFLDIFFHWDSGWYHSIVQQGYSYVAGKQSNVVFYPLYPLLVKALYTVVGHVKVWQRYHMASDIVFVDGQKNIIAKHIILFQPE